MRYYEIKAHPYRFHAIVQKPKEGRVWRVQIGGHQTCVIFNVEEDDEELIAYMEGLTFYPECSVDKAAPLVRGIGTTRLLKASITFLYQLLPTIKVIYFQDTSRITCHIENSIDNTIQLHIYYISKKGKTWYEETLGARLDDELMTVYEQQKGAALGVYREARGFAEFRKRYMRSVLDVFPPEIMDIVQRAYEGHTTYRAMFSELARDYDCSIMFGWLERYFRKTTPILFHEVQWNVNRNGFDMTNIEVKRIREAPAMKPLLQWGGKKPRIIINIERRR